MINSLNKLLFLDFDGVLFDTVEESYLVISSLFPKDKFDFERFKKYRYLIGPAWNYKYLIEAISYPGLVNIEDYYFKKIKYAKSEDYKYFETIFFKERESIKNSSSSRWSSHNTPYYFTHQLINLKIESKYLYIISTKDQKSILDTLNSHNINIIKVDNIYGKEKNEKFGGKHRTIKHLMNINAPAKAIFIDDMINYLNECKLIPHLTLLQADWGYCNPNYISKFKMNQSQVLNEIINFFK